MVSGCIKKSKKDSREFPISGDTNWFIILTIKEGKIIQKYFTGTKKDKTDLLRKIKNLNKDKIYFKLYGIWPGRWNTHVFDLEVKIIIKKLEDLLGQG